MYLCVFGMKGMIPDIKDRSLVSWLNHPTYVVKGTVLLCYIIITEIYMDVHFLKEAAVCMCLCACKH